MSRMVNSATIRVGTIGAIPAVFEELGLDFPRALATVGLPPTIFDDPESMIPYTAFDRLLDIGARESGCEHIGLLVGMTPPDLGLPGFLMVNAPTARAGLHELVGAINRIDGGGVVALNDGAGVASLTYSVIANNLRCVNCIYDAAAAIGYGLLRRLIGSDFGAVEVRLPRRAPGDAAPYRAFFNRARIRFDSHEAAIEFPSSLLELSIASADPALYRFLKHVQEKDGGGGDSSMSDQIRRVLPNLIRRKEVNNKVVSQMFGLHPRTMARRLAVENVTLHALVEDARFEVAKQLLRDTNIPLTEIAADLYYSDASAFTRAFRRKFATTPGEWRRERRRSERGPDGADSSRAYAASRSGEA
jgi:AraC-like DNA-binding protein